MNQEEIAVWRQRRDKGILSFISLHGGVFWGLPMMFISGFAYDIFDQGMFTKQVLLHMVKWWCFGMLAGVLIWVINQRRYKKAVIEKAE